MEYNIVINRNELQQEVDLRTYYMGEAIKRKDIDADTIESSTDEHELFTSILNKALNELVTSIIQRFSSVKYNVEEEYACFSFESEHQHREDLLPLLKQKIKDYLINELISNWFSLRQPMLAQNYQFKHKEWLSETKDVLSMFYNKKKGATPFHQSCRNLRREQKRNHRNKFETFEKNIIAL